MPQIVAVDFLDRPILIMFGRLYLGGLIIAFTGLIDDIKELSPMLKMGGLFWQPV